MSQSGTVAGTVLRISVVSDDRRLDVGVPSQVPLVEIIPGFARSLGVLDPTLTHGGYALQRADGTPLDPARGAAAQGVHDGELLTLVRGGLMREPRIYDDVVEAVIDATAEQHNSWTPADSSRTALFVSLTFLALCAVLLVATPPTSLLPAIIAGSGAVVLSVAAAVLMRLRQPEAGHALGLTAAAYGGLAGYPAVPAQRIWGWPLAALGPGLVAVGGLSLAVTQDKPEIHLVPIALGASIGITATAAAVFGDPLAAAGTRTLIALRAALGLAALIATPLVAASGVTGAVLCVLAFVGMMFQSRQMHARLGVLVLMAIGAIGLAATGVTVALALPDVRTWMLLILVVATVVLIGLTLLTPKARLRLTRLGDTVEVVALALLLPLGVITAGLV